MDLPLAYIESFHVFLAALVFNVTICSAERLNRALSSPLAQTSRFVDLLERRYNRPELTEEMRKNEGISTVATFILMALLIGLAFGWGLSLVPYGWVAEALIIGTLLPVRSHLDNSRSIERALSNSLEEGRAFLAFVSPRETQGLDEAGVARGAIEVTARTTVDGVIAPFFWYGLFGLAGFLVFRVVNIAAQLIDERTHFAACFGWFAARANDALLWVPTRIAGLFIAFAALFVRQGHPIKAVSTMLRDAPKRPNQVFTWSFAAMAGALNVRLGGPRIYYQEPLDSPWLGDGQRYPDTTDIHRGRLVFLWACSLVILCTVLLALIAAPLPLSIY